MAEPRGPLGSTGFWLHHAALRWRRELDVGLAPLGLTPTQFHLLASTSWLCGEGGTAIQQAVADHAGCDRMMTSRVLATLEARGLVTRTPDPDNRRTKALAVTAEGRDVVLRAVRIVARIDDELFGTERDDLRRRLRQVAGSPG